MKDLALSQYNVTAEQIRDCNWERAAADPRFGYAEIYLALSKLSAEQSSAGDEVKGRALKLLADAMSMMMNPTNTNTPFDAMFYIGERRSALVDDFSPEDLEAMFEACKGIDNPLIKARLADIAWLAQKPRNPEAARAACDAYVEVPIEVNSYIHVGALDTRRRAISLLRQLGRSEQGRLDALQTELLQTVRDAAATEGFYLKKVSHVLLEGKLGLAAAPEIAALLHVAAKSAHDRHDLRTARIYFNEAAEWFALAKEGARQMDCLCAAAETFVLEADDRIADATPSHISAASFYEEAIQAYRRIPNEARKSRGLENRIADIQVKMNQSGRMALERWS